MMQESDSHNIYEQLKEAVAVTLNPNIEQNQRLLAYRFIEKVQDDPSLAVQVGFQLCDTANDSPVRHLGLQLVENAIKYHWAKLTPDFKVFIKDSTINLVNRGTRGISSEEAYIKDKISRLFVEMIKREWPQQWPSLLDELNFMANQGATQTELVLRIFVRLSEDIATLKTLENSTRCHDIHQALCDNLINIFNFFFALLEEHYNKYINCSDNAQSEDHCKIVQALMITISSYIEWVGFQYFKSHLQQLCSALCKLLFDQKLKLVAADCLLQLSSRKLDSKDCYFVKQLFESDIFESIDKVAKTKGSDYNLQKILVQVITNIGTLLITKLSKDDRQPFPATMGLFLRTLLTFTCHQSFVVSSHAFPLWNLLFKRDVFLLDPLFQEIIPHLIEISFQKILRHGFPSVSDEASQYSKMDFSSDQEYSSIFYNQRADICSTLRLVAASIPEQFYNYFHKCFLLCLNFPPTPLPTCEKEICLSDSPVASAWERLGVILEGVVAKVRKLQTFKPMLQKNIELIRACLQYECNDPVVLTSVLNCLSGLSVFIEFSPDILPLFLDKFFSACTFSIPGHMKGNRPKKVKLVRKHSAALIVKLASSYPYLMLNYFDIINEKIADISRDREELTILEKTTLDQARLILGAYIKDNDKHNAFLSNLLHQAKEDWNSVSGAISSPFSLMEAIGLNKEPPASGNKDLCTEKRSALHYSLSTFNAVTRRSVIPNEIRKSLYNCDLSASSPALAHLVPFFPSLCHLLRSHNGLWTEGALVHLNPAFAKAYHVSLPQRKEICCLHSKHNLNLNAELNIQDNSPVHKMQGFTIQLTEDLYTLLGSLPKLGIEFYKMPHLTEYLIHSALYNLNKFSDFRMRLVIRLFMRPFIFSCPEEHQQTVILPLLYHFCPIIKDFLSSRWEKMREKVQSGNYNPDTTDLDEMFEDAILRLLTRDYVDFTRDLLRWDGFGKNTQEKNGDNRLSSEGVEEEMETEAVKMGSLGDQEEKFKMGSLGRAILLCDPICNALISTLLKAFSWMDSTGCKKTLVPLMVILRGMMQDTPQHLNQEAISQILTSIINGIHFHGKHQDVFNEINDFACTVYELFRPHFPAIRQILVDLPNSSESDVDQLDLSIMKAQPEDTNLKKLNRLKKSSFRKIINGIIEKDLSEAFKKEVEIRDLPPMFKIPRLKQVQLDKGPSDFNLSFLFKDPL